MTITALPPAPSTSDPTNFAAKADALLAALATFVTEANALAVAMNLNSTTDTSATSNSIATGAKTFTVTAGKSFQPGMFLVIADTAAPSTNWMYGQVTSYSGTSLVMEITVIGGSGTKTAWTISQSAAYNIAGSLSQAFSAAALTAAGLVDLSGAAAGQIKFPATQNASANANTLDDYEEGTWTPSIGGTATYTTQLGYYTKIGNVVVQSFHLRINVLGTGSTTVITGMPFTPITVNAGAAQYTTSATNITTLVSSHNGSNIFLSSATAAAASLSQNAIFQANAIVNATNVYTI